MTENEAIALFKCLADRSRLQILKSLCVEPMYVERLAERLNLSPSTISFHVKKLEASSVVYPVKEQYYVVYHLRKEVLKKSMLSFLLEESQDIDNQEAREQAYRQKVLDSFFSYGKLKSIPVQRKKRLIVLEEIVKHFEFDRVYKEKEVNVIIMDFFDDFCTIRRELIGEKMMDRNYDGYWRCKNA